jgi:aldehyde dehydrogenase (NAD+)
VTVKKFTLWAAAAVAVGMFALAGYVSAGSVESAKRVGKQIRAGNVNLNGVPNERTAPFGGYKQSGNGREMGRYGIEEFLELKAIQLPEGA